MMMMSCLFSWKDGGGGGGGGMQAMFMVTIPKQTFFKKRVAANNL